MSQTPYTYTASFRAKPQQWAHFKKEVHDRGITLCHVLEGLMEAWIAGQAAGLDATGSPPSVAARPVTVNLTMQHVVKRPRRMANLEDVIYNCRRQRWPPNCEHADVYVKSTREVGCLDLRDHIKLEKCWRCFLTRRGS